MPKKQPSSEEFRFPGFTNPNYTQVPDDLFDVLLPTLSGAEVKVLLYIVRRTFGFKRDSDNISLNQIASGITKKDGQVLDRGTGLSKRHVQRALQSLEAKNIIKVSRRMADDGRNEVNVYSLNIREGKDITSPGWRHNVPRVETEVPQGVGTPMSTTTNSNIQETVKQHTEANVVSSLKDLGISKRVAQELAKKFPAEYIYTKIDYFVWLVRNQKHRVKHVGFLISAIKDDYKPDGISDEQAWKIVEADEKLQRSRLNSAVKSA